MVKDEQQKLTIADLFLIARAMHNKHIICSVGVSGPMRLSHQQRGLRKISEVRGQFHDLIGINLPYFWQRIDVSMYPRRIDAEMASLLPWSDTTKVC